MVGCGQGHAATAIGEDVSEQPLQPRDVLRNIVNLLPSGCHVLLHRHPLIQQTERKTCNTRRRWRYSAFHNALHDRIACPERRRVDTMWGEQKARELVMEAGFKKIETKQVEGDILNYYSIARKD